MELSSATYKTKNSRAAAFRSAKKKTYVRKKLDNPSLTNKDLANKEQWLNVDERKIKTSKS